MTTGVKIIKSTDSGAPVLSGTAGALLGVLDCCLIVNNVRSTADDASFNNNDVEARLEAGTPFLLFPTAFGAAGDRTYIGMPVKFDRVKFNFATPQTGGTAVYEYWNGSAWTALVSATDGTTGLTANGTITWTIASQTGWAANAVNSITQFWIRARVTGTPLGVSPLVNYITVGGWTRAFSGTNLAAYRQGGGSGLFLRIDDTGTTNGRGVGYEAMTAISTGTGLFPTDVQISGGNYWSKSATADATARLWIAAATDRMIILQVSHTSTANATDAFVGLFGDIKSYKSGDAYGVLHIGGTVTPATANQMHNIVTSVGSTCVGHYMPRGYSQLGTSVLVGKHTDSAKFIGGTTMGGSVAMPYPNGPDGGLYLAPVWVHEIADSSVRGSVPGVWAPMHNKPLQHLDTFSGTGALAGRTFLALKMYTASEMFLETSDTWDT